MLTFNARNNGGQTPLHLAVAEANKEVAELLLAHGADVNAKDNAGKTPLRWVVIQRRAEPLPKEYAKLSRRSEIAAPARRPRIITSKQSYRRNAFTTVSDARLGSWTGAVKLTINGHNRPISAHSQGVRSLRVSAAILVRRLERRWRQLRAAPIGSARRNISSAC